ncbi:MAG TPA: universal stress protein [Gaiellaceae bacterium]|nr:universal stress protein [Gaiellaceae bacterium]
MLIWYDGSADARLAVEAAARLLASRPALVLAVTPVTVALGYSAFPTDAPYVDAAGDTAALTKAQEGAEHARRLGLRADAREHHASDVSRGVREVADQIDAAVIVIGSRRRTSLRKFAEEGLAHDLVERAGRPVLVVPR